MIDSSVDLKTIIFRMEPGPLASDLEALPAQFGKSPAHSQALHRLLQAFALSSGSAPGMQSLQTFTDFFMTHMLVMTSLGDLAFCHSSCACERCSMGRLYQEAHEKVDHAAKAPFLKYYEHALKQALFDKQSPPDWGSALETFLEFEPVVMRALVTSRDFWTYWKRPKWSL